MRSRLALIALLTLSLGGLLAGSTLAARTQEATPTADLEANKALARRFHDELFEQGNMAAAAEILAPDFVWHYPLNQEFAVGPEAATQWVADNRSFFPDLVLSDDDEIAEGDRVVIRWTLTGTAQTEGGPVPVTVTGIDIFRIEDGQLAELWQLYDEAGLQQQLAASVATPPAMGTPTS